MGKILIILLMIMIQGISVTARDHTNIQVNDTIKKPEISRIGKQLQVRPGLKALSVTQQIESGLSNLMDKFTEQPNTQTVWSKIKLEASDFLYSFYRDGKLKGTKPADAYYVNIGPQSMTAQDIASGKKILIVGYAAIKPAEFEIIRMERTPSGK
ncbi:MAG: hypothetical protein IPK57_00535 [Chitinophagaceae bacterium]|nr:hypothetical protein [Chitinophagaceae bacterium]